MMSREVEDFLFRIQVDLLLEGIWIASLIPRHVNCRCIIMPIKRDGVVADLENFS